MRKFFRSILIVGLTSMSAVSFGQETMEHGSVMDSSKKEVNVEGIIEMETEGEFSMDSSSVVKDSSSIVKKEELHYATEIGERVYSYPSNLAEENKVSEERMLLIQQVEKMDVKILKTWVKKKYKYDGTSMKAEDHKTLVITRLRHDNEGEPINIVKEDVQVKTQEGSEAWLRGGRCMQGSYRSDLPEIPEGLSYVEYIFAIPTGEKPKEIILFDRVLKIETIDHK